MKPARALSAPPCKPHAWTLVKQRNDTAGRRVHRRCANCKLEQHGLVLIADIVPDSCMHLADAILWEPGPLPPSELPWQGVYGLFP